MQVVWITFVSIAVVLAGCAWGAWRYKGKQNPAFRTVAKYLLVLAAGPAFFPAFLSATGVTVWVAGYIVFVTLLTAAMTTTAVRQSRRQVRT